MYAHTKNASHRFSIIWLGSFRNYSGKSKLEARFLTWSDHTGVKVLLWLTCFVPLGTSKWQLVMRPTSALTMCQATHSHYTFSKAFYIYIEWTNSWMDKFLFNYPNDGNFQTGLVILTCPSRQSDVDTTTSCSKILRCRHQWSRTQEWRGTHIGR